VIYKVFVNVVFGDKHLAKVETDHASDLKFPIAVIRAAQRKLTVLKAAPDERTLRNWKSLHYEKLKGDRKGQNSIRLNDQWRMVLEVDNQTNPPTVTIIGIEDYH